MKLPPNLLAVPLVLLAAGLVALVAVQTAGGLEQVERAEQEKARTLQRTTVSAIRGVVRYGRDKEERVAAVLEEIARDPQVLAVALLDGEGRTVAAKGAPGATPDGAAARPRVLRLVERFEVSWGGGCGHAAGATCGGEASGCGCGQAAQGTPARAMQLVLVFDRRPAERVRALVLFEAVALSAIIAFAALIGGLLLRSVRQRERLARRVALEAHQRQSLESLQLLAAGLAHEIRNPLAAIRGYTQLAHEQAPQGEARAKSALVLGELDRISERLEEFLSFARRRSPKLAPLDLGALAAEVVALLRPDAQSGGIDLRLAAPEEPVMCRGDAAQLKELLLNLTLNAIEACKQGDTVTIAVRERLGAAEIAVRDTGRGIEPDDLPRVFEPYFTTRPGGSGLGLCISQRIAEAHGAELGIESSPGRGTTVTLHLRRER